MSTMTVSELIEAVEQKLETPMIDYYGSAVVKLIDGIVTVEVIPQGELVTEEEHLEGPKVDLLKRLGDVLGGSVVPPIQVGEVDYCYDAGREWCDESRGPGFGSSGYFGVYHPDVACEGGLTCQWCGQVLT